MKIATWNVNSVKARLPHVLAWLKSAAPDVALLQELKCVADAFPRLEIEADEVTLDGGEIQIEGPLVDDSEGRRCLAIPVSDHSEAAAAGDDATKTGRFGHLERVAETLTLRERERRVRQGSRVPSGSRCRESEARG